MLHNFENKCNVIISHFNFISNHFKEIIIGIKMYSVVQCFKFISIRSCTKMPTLPFLCIMGKYELLHTVGVVCS